MQEQPALFRNSKLMFHGRSEVKTSLCCPKTVHVWSLRQNTVSFDFHACSEKSLTCFSVANRDRKSVV